jgi:prepilin-type N-terminal cleavage/methylation domain-containing protein
MMGSSSHVTDSERGMTVVELAVAVALLGIVLSAAMGFFSSALLRGSEVSEASVLQAETRQTLDQLVRELRQSTSGREGVASIESMSASSITFLTPDASSPVRMRRVSYRVNQNALERTVILSTDSDGYPWTFSTLPAYDPVLGSVRNTNVFVYKNDVGTVTSTPGDVHTVEITLDIDPFPSSGSGANTYTVAVHPRSSS